MMRKLSLSFLWFLLVFGPVVNSPFGALSDVSLLAIAGYLGWSLINFRNPGKSLLPFAIYSVMLTCLAIFSSLIASTVLDGSSLQAVLRPLKGFVILAGLFYIVRRASRIRASDPRSTYESILGFLYLATLLHAAIIVLQFLFPAFRDLCYQLFGGESVLEFYRNFRMPGLAGAGGSQVSAVQGIGFLLGVHLMLLRSAYAPFLVGNALLVSSMVLTGRTGFVLVAISIMYWVWMRLSGRVEAHRVKGPTRLAMGVIGFFAAVSVAFWMFPRLLTSYSEESWLYVAVNRTLDTYFNYLNTGEFTDDTLVALSGMYVLPGSVFVWLFGDARLYDNTLAVYASDIGYVRQWWGYGIVGVLLHVLFYLTMGYYMARRHVRLVMGPNVAFGFCMLFSIFVLNYKESFFFSRMSFQISVVVMMGLYWLASRNGEGREPSRVARSLG